MCLAAHARGAITGEGFQLRILSFGLPGEDLVLDSTGFLLGEGLGRNGASQRRGSS